MLPLPRVALIAAVAVLVWTADRLTKAWVVASVPLNEHVDVGIPAGWRFWAFNVADSSITVGIVLVTLLLYLEERRQRPA